MKLTVKIAPTTIIATWDCAFCGEPFQGGNTLADLFDEAGEHHGVVCPTCLASIEQRTWARADLEMPAPALRGVRLPERGRFRFHPTHFLPR